MISSHQHKSSKLLAVRLTLTTGALVALLCITAPVSGQQSTLTALLALVRYQNTACNGDLQDSGTCLADAECTRRSGQSIGSCANGYATCCSFKFTCGAKTSQNDTVFVNRNYPKQDNGTDTCQVTIEKSPNVCQVRLDFDEFKLAQPDENGLCSTDSFMVRTTVGERLPILCGDNNGQHMYIDLGRESSNPIVLSMVTNGEKFLRRWKIRISTVACNHLDMAPSGCLQYYRSPSAVVKSFNYGSRLEGRARYLANQRYTSCVRTEENFCAIRWDTEQQGSFSFGGINERIQLPLIHAQLDPAATSASSNASIPSEQVVAGAQVIGAAGTGAACNFDDFVGVDQASTDGVGAGRDRFCGNQLGEFGAIISRSKPFELKVRTNSAHAANALSSQQGFALRYVQLPCVI